MWAQSGAQKSHSLHPSIISVQCRGGIGSCSCTRVSGKFPWEKPQSPWWGRRQRAGGNGGGTAAGGWEGTFRSLHWGRVNVLEGGASSSPAAHWPAGACPRNVKLLPSTQGWLPPLQSPQCDFCQEGKAFIDVTENGHLRTCMNSMRSHKESW